ncbi:septation protein SepH [Cryptosporangium aurantiacum]|uniref:DUF3071 domain-containing protein n=1 Tax=Cryptosporangium aurantiacum TaxID=134849 RepID=A0A1M7N174_9ACTN|nr:septation protein SepH [Cryptosporangium aurantiacum]SHM96675.1 Protein of unknown function [Cryptosporangium aurantiacum]
MRPLRFVALSADGQAMILTDEVGRMLSLAIDDQVIAAVQRERTGTPGQLSMDVEATLTPRDIQSRIRSGESAEHVARLANVPMEKVLRFAGPVLQERAAMAQLARRTRLRGADSGQTLADVVDGRLRAHGIDVETVAWDSYRRDDGGWRTTATWPSGKATAHAIWDLDRSRSMVTPVDEMASFLSSEKTDLLIGPDEQMLAFGLPAGKLPDDADPKEGPVVPALSMLRRRDERRREEPVAAPEVAAAPTREVPRELPREGRGDLRQAARESGRSRALDPRFDDLRRPAPPRETPAPTPTPEPPAADAGTGPAAPAASARDGLRGAGWLDEPRPAAGAPGPRPDEVRRPDPWGDDPRRPAGRRGDAASGGEPQPTSGGGGFAGRSDWRERLDPTGVGTPPAANPAATPPPAKGGSGRSRKAELPSWDDILFGSGARRGS